MSRDRKWYNFSAWDVIMPDEGVKYELDLGDPPQEYMDWAKSELGETPEVRKEKLDEFRNLIFERGECVPHRTDDAFLLRFLRTRYFVVERAHKLLVNYYHFKENNPEFFENVHILQLETASKVITVPPYRTQTGRRVLLYRFGDWDPTEISITQLFQATMAIMELAVLEPKAQILGGIAMFDLGGLTLQQAWYMTPTIAKRMVQIMVTHFPMRVTAIHIVNQSWLFDMIYNIFKPFLDERMKERIYFHGTDWESLHKHIYPKYLPQRYGGVHEDYDYKPWLKHFVKTPKIVEEVISMGYVIDEEAHRRVEEIMQS